MNKIIQFLQEVRIELGKVVWPTRREALKITGIVIIFCVFVSIFLGIVDFGVSKLIALIVQ